MRSAQSIGFIYFFMNTNKNSPRLQKTRVLKPHLNKKHHILSSTNINIFTTPHNISYPNRSFFLSKKPTTGPLFTFFTDKSQYADYSYSCRKAPNGRQDKTGINERQDQNTRKEKDRMIELHPVSTERQPPPTKHRQPGIPTKIKKAGASSRHPSSSDKQVFTLLD